MKAVFPSRDCPAIPPVPARRRVSLVMTVLNELAGTAEVLDTLTVQTRRPDDVLVVDGGSTDGTVELVRRAAERNPTIRLLRAPGANIAQGRNLGMAAAHGEIIVLTDAGCRLDPQWVERLAAPFEECPDTEFVAGLYRIDPHTLLEAVIGLATMPGALDPVDPATFNPSARSMAFTKRLWERVGGFPEWLQTAEDTLFDWKVRSVQARWHFAADAVVYWRPRKTLGQVYRQFRGYALGEARLGRGGRDVIYHVRNLLLTAACGLGGLLYPPVWAASGGLFAYFYVYAFHRKSRRIAAHLGTWRAYPLSLLVHGVLVLATVEGGLRARLQDRKKRERWRQALAGYLSPQAVYGGRVGPWESQEARDTAPEPSSRVVPGPCHPTLIGYAGINPATRTG